MDETRRYPCPYPDCAEDNSAKARFCSRCGRPLNIKAMRAAESWRGGWFKWGGVLLVAVTVMAFTIRRSTDFAPFIWMAIMVVAWIIASQKFRGSSQLESQDRERLP